MEEHHLCSNLGQINMNLFVMMFLGHLFMKPSIGLEHSHYEVLLGHQQSKHRDLFLLLDHFILNELMSETLNQ